MGRLIQHQSGMALRRTQARLNPRCVICGSENSNGLRLQFTAGPSGAHAQWNPTAEWESFETTVHGGIIGAVLDEAMSKAVIAREWEALTAELRVRFRRRIAPGEQVEVRGWVVQRKRRHIKAEASFAVGGKERAHAWGVFLTTDDTRAISHGMPTETGGGVRREGRTRSRVF